jgi:hypothetical protein
MTACLPAAPFFLPAAYYHLSTLCLLFCPMTACLLLNIACPPFACCYAEVSV